MAALRTREEPETLRVLKHAAEGINNNTIKIK